MSDFLIWSASLMFTLTVYVSLLALTGSRIVTRDVRDITKQQAITAVILGVMCLAVGWLL